MERMNKNFCNLHFSLNKRIFVLELSAQMEEYFCIIIIDGNLYYKRNTSQH